MKSTIAIGLIIVPLAFFAGCGGDKEESSTPTTGSNTPQIDNSALARAKGKSIFKKTCVACHGENGEGIENLGKDWTESDFIANSSDDELVEFLKVGRTLDDPMSDGKAIMPPKGGDPTLTDEDLHNVVKFMRTLQG